MNEGLHISQRVESYPLKPAAKSAKSSWTWHAAVAAAGFAGGFLSAAVGAALTVASWLVGSEGAGAGLQRVATVLFFLTIPLLILGAHCLDLAEERAAKSARRRLLAVAQSERFYDESDSDYVN
jgi:hypothetical protein